MASENGVEMSDEEAGICYARLHRSGELSDDEIDNVAGGGCVSRDFYCMGFDGKYEPRIGHTCANCNNYSVADGNCKLGYSMED